MDKFTSKVSTLVVILCSFLLVACGSSGSNASEVPDSTGLSQTTLIINVTGSGSVHIEETGQTCHSSCEFLVPTRTPLTLTGLPGNNTSLAGWSYNCFVLDNQCKLYLVGGMTVTADFQTNIINNVAVGVSISGGGSIIVSELDARCSSNCNYQVASGTELTFIAEPNPGNTFTDWGGVCAAGESTCSLTILSDTVLAPVFTAVANEATLSLSVQGSGKIEVDGTAIRCEASCTHTFETGTEITLNARPESTSIFQAYNSDVCASDNAKCTFILEQNASVTAIFKNTSTLSNNNTLLITEPLGQSRTNYPVQIGRLFVKGEIKGIPKLTYENQTLTTQVDVKQRYDDGSLKHAILSFVLPNIAANEKIFIELSDNGTTNNNPLTHAQITNSNIKAGIEFNFENNSNAAIDVADMIDKGLYTFWTKGPINTTIVVADHSAQRQFDIGHDQHKSIRPSFVVSIWPGIEKHSVRYIVENTNTETLQDVRYNVALNIDNAANVFYQKSDVPHQAMTRWTKLKWSGADLQPLSINHNINYLTRIPSIPNYDTKLEIPESAIAEEWNKWQSKDRDLYERGFWDPRMGNAGGRPDIGIYASWAVKWLFSGDWRHQEIALRAAELSGAWPIHLREGDSNRFFDFDNQVDAIGKILSIAPGGRPSHWTDRPDWHEVKDNDKIIPITPIVKTEWRPDTSHHPDLSTIQYLFTGDFFYLEQMLFSAAYVTGNNNARAFDKPIGRGPTGSEGALYYLEARTQAWALRTRVHTYDLLPDDFPEKAYFHHLNKNAITMYEGMYHLPISDPQRQDLYTFVKDNVSTAKFARSGGPSPLGFWDEGISSSGYVNENIFHTDGLFSAIAPWMQNFMIVALGRAQDIGYDTKTLRAYAGKPIVEPFAVESINYDMLTAYATPVLDNNQNWFTSWQDVHAHYQQSYIDKIRYRLTTGTDTEHGYYGILMAATSYLQHIEGYEKAWKYVEDNVKTKTIYNLNPKWAILPREQ